MKEVLVKIPAAQPGSYAITIGSQLLQSILPGLKEKFPGRSFFLVTDKNLQSLGYADALAGSSPKELKKYVLDPPGESSKTMVKIYEIVEAMELSGLGRDTCVIALGGGVVGDMAGFAAGIFKRGVPVVQVPTTTVSQADSAIGGKTGVDSTISKNAYGVFWQPAAVYIDVSTLQTLDDRQYRAGLVESLKHALILDAAYFEYICDNMSAILSRDQQVLEELAFKNCTIKALVVEADPFEKNYRQILNYGHTIGHAVESASNYQLLHGEAVAIGIIAAAMIEIEMGLGSENRLAQIKHMLSALNMPTKIPAGIDPAGLITLLAHDKKAVAKLPQFVLLDEIGKVHTQDGRYAVPVESSIIESVLALLV